MDILNWLYLAKNKFVRTTLGSEKDLMIFGSKVGFNKRGDLYQNYAMSVEDFTAGLSSPIARLGTTLYATNFETSGFSTINGIFFGDVAGANATNAINSNFFGPSAGSFATNASNSNFFGSQAGTNATDADTSNFLGALAGYNATNAAKSNFFGFQAGAGATTAGNSNFLGYQAGLNCSGGGASIFIGFQAGMNSSGTSVNAFGTRAHKGGTLSGQTVFSNSSMPTFANHAAAVAAITVPLGASVDCTYLYHNQATNSIGAVRL